MYKYWWKSKYVLPVLVCYQEYLETTRLLHYPNNRNTFRGTITSQLFTFVESFACISWTQGQSHVFASIYSLVYKSRGQSCWHFHP